MWQREEDDVGAGERPRTCRLLHPIGKARQVWLQRAEPVTRAAPGGYRAYLELRMRGEQAQHLTTCVPRRSSDGRSHAHGRTSRCMSMQKLQISCNTEGGNRLRTGTCARKSGTARTDVLRSAVHHIRSEMSIFAMLPGRGVVLRGAESCCRARSRAAGRGVVQQGAESCSRARSRAAGRGAVQQGTESCSSTRQQADAQVTGETAAGGA